MSGSTTTLVPTVYCYEMSLLFAIVRKVLGLQGIAPSEWEPGPQLISYMTVEAGHLNVFSMCANCSYKQKKLYLYIYIFSQVKQILKSLLKKHNFFLNISS